MTFRNSSLTLIAAAVAILPLAACGSDRMPLTTAPSSAPTTVAVAASVARSAHVSPLEDTGVAITSLVTSTSCPTLQFNISTYLVKTDAATAYSGGTCASLKAGTLISLTTTRASTDSQLVVYASQITIHPGTTTPTPPTPTPPAPLEGSVTINSLTGTCPNVTFMEGTYAFKVSSSTSYSGATCADIKVGSRFSFVGTKSDSDSFIVVTGLVAKPTTTTTPPTTTTPTPPTTTTPTPPTTTTAVPVSTDVTITAVTGVCPDVTFLAGTYAFKVSASTGYSGATCADLKVGAKVSVVGTKRDSDAFVVVTGLGIKRDTTTTPTAPTQPVEGQGVITSVTTVAPCPALQFFIGTYLIKVDTSTQYANGSCTDLKPGVTVYVKGGVNADGSVSASSITVQTPAPPPPTPEVEGEGVVTGIVFGSACPALQVQIGEYTVTLTAATQFVGGSCARVAIGKTLDVRGTMTGDKTATASLVTFKN